MAISETKDCVGGACPPWSPGVKRCCYDDDSLNKNSSGDEIANVNFLRRYGTYVLQNTKKENLLRLTN